MKKWLLILPMLIFAFWLNGCSSPQQEENTQSQLSPPTVSEEETSPTETAMETAAVPDPVGLFPAGVISFIRETYQTLLSNLDGKVISEWEIRGMIAPPLKPDPPTWLHFGGPTHQGLIEAPLFYLASPGGELAVSYHMDKTPVIALQPVKGVVNMVGAPGKPVVVFAAYDPQNVNEFNHARFGMSPTVESDGASEPPAVQSWLYTATTDYESGGDLLLSHTDENGYALYPLALDLNGTQVQGIWYVLKFLGSYLAGPIIFVDYGGLYYLDGGTGQVTEKLDFQYHVLALSDDRKLVAYLDTQESGETAVIIQDLDGGENRQIEILADSHPSGVGDGHFTPGGEYLVWREVYLGEDSLSSQVRIASSTGEELIEIREEEISWNNTQGETFGIKIAGWLDRSTLLLEVFFETETRLYTLVPGELTADFLAEGSFLGFTYPE